MRGARGVRQRNINGLTLEFGPGGPDGPDIPGARVEATGRGLGGKVESYVRKGFRPFKPVKPK